jgi:hypothetical protein
MLDYTRPIRVKCSHEKFEVLRERLSQRSFSVEFPDDTVWDILEIGR